MSQVTVALKSLKFAPYGLFVEKSAFDDGPSLLFWLTEEQQEASIDKDILSADQILTLQQGVENGVIRVSGLEEVFVPLEDEGDVPVPISSKGEEEEGEEEGKNYPYFSGASVLLNKTVAEIREELKVFIKQPNVYSFLRSAVELERSGQNRKTVIGMLLRGIEAVKKTVLLSQPAEDTEFEIEDEPGDMALILPRQARKVTK